MFQDINRYALLYVLEERNNGSSMDTSEEEDTVSSSHPKGYPQQQQLTIKKLQHPMKHKAKHINFSTLSTKHRKKRQKNKRDGKETSAEQIKSQEKFERRKHIDNLQAISAKNIAGDWKNAKVLHCMGSVVGSTK
ncbi:hypothetical protein BDA99DRAFT_227159 [Phascolomyces articulosus]|uniref:Uncharacterized protein n=1 Tax=Phascolomyces articulosus TaxID=60185 RepID=A0AAD5JPU4_9FUNG|nr:hypothetical protein BDA99DRAFT_227159 [Phascolomyces articulosus]